MANRQTTEAISALRAIQVRLNTDLTRYHPELKVGAEGTTRFEDAPWGIWCTFPGAGRWDIIESGLDILDVEYLEARNAEWDEATRREQDRLKIHPRFVRYYQKTHLQIDTNKDWNMLLACGKTAKSGSSGGFLLGNEIWCPGCKTEYEKRVREGIYPQPRTL